MSETNLALKSFICPKKIFEIHKTILVVDLTFQFKIYSLKNEEFMKKNSPIFYPKINPKTMFFYTSLDAISSFANIDGPVAFLLYDLECYFFLKWRGIYNLF